MGVLTAIKGYRTIAGLLSVIVGLLLRGGDIGDGGLVEQVAQWLTLLGGTGLAGGGLIAKIKREAAEKATEALKGNLSPGDADKIKKMLPELIDHIYTRARREAEKAVKTAEPTKDDGISIHTWSMALPAEIAAARERALEAMRGYRPNDAASTGEPEKAEGEKQGEAANENT